MTDRSERTEKNDPYTGIPWVQVSSEQVRAHPKGRLTPVLWAIAAFFVLSGLVKMWLLRDAGLGTMLLIGVWPVLAGIGLAIRAPWAIILAVVSAGITLYSLLVSMDEAQGVFYLFETVAAVGIVFYLMDGDRPNFIYRHRYRKYSVLKGRSE